MASAEPNTEVTLVSKRKEYVGCLDLFWIKERRCTESGVVQNLVTFAATTQGNTTHIVVERLYKIGAGRVAGVPNVFNKFYSNVRPPETSQHQNWKWNV